MLQHVVTDLEPPAGRQVGGARQACGVDESTVGGAEIRDDDGVLHHADTAVSAGHTPVGKNQVCWRQATDGDGLRPQLDAAPRPSAFHHDEVMHALVRVRAGSRARKARTEDHGRIVD